MHCSTNKGSGHLWKLLLRDEILILRYLKSANFCPLLNSPKFFEYIEYRHMG